MIRTILLIALAAGLTACSPTRTIYGPAEEGSRAVGYDSVRIEDNRWRVSFTGGPDVSASTVERYALRRAAEITLDHGDEWFHVVDRSGQRAGHRDSPVSVGGSIGGAVGSGGYRSSGVGIGIGISPGQERRTTMTLEIRTGSGEPKPELAYDAGEVLAAM